MRILLAIDERNHPRVVAEYIAQRFGVAATRVDVVTVIPPIARPQARTGESAFVSHRLADELAQRRAKARIDACVEALSASPGAWTIRGSVERGDVAGTLIDACTRYASDVILLQSRARRGLLSRLRVASITRRVLAGAPCAVELLRPHATPARALHQVVIPVNLEEAGTAAIARIARQPWPAGTRLHLLGMLPVRAEETCVEANGLRVQAAMEAACRDQQRMRALLESACADLARTSSPAVEIDYDIAWGPAPDIVRDAAVRLRASMVVLGATSTPGLAGLLRGSGTTSLALSMPCPVLVLRGHAGQGRRIIDPGFAAG